MIRKKRNSDQFESPTKQKDGNIIFDDFKSIINI